MKKIIWKISKVFFVSVAVFFESASASLQAQGASDAYKIRFDTEIYLRSSLNDLRKENPANPDNELVPFREKHHIFSPSFSFRLSKGFTKNLNIRGRGVFATPEFQEESSTAKGYLTEFYWRQNLLGGRLIFGKYLETTANTYFNSPAALLLRNRESVELTETLGKDYEAGNLLVKYSGSFGGITVSGIVADYKDVDFFDEEIEETQFMLRFGTEFFEGGASADLLFHQTTENLRSAGLIYSQQIGNDTVAYAHAAVKETKHRVRPVALGTPASLPSAYGYEFEPEKRADTSYTAGIQFTSSVDSVNLIFEYYQNNAGLSEDEAMLLETGLKTANENAAYADPNYNFPAGNPYEGFIKQTLKRLAQGRLRQCYLNFRLDSGDFFNGFDAFATAIYNADDGSSLLTLEAEKEIQDALLKVFWTRFSGPEFSEFRMLPFTYQTGLSLNYKF